jgi:hypothetical protein
MFSGCCPFLVAGLVCCLGVDYDSVVALLFGLAF